MKPLHEAMGDRKLFGRTFSGPTFGAWRTVAKILDAVPLAREELKLYRALTGRDAAPRAPFTEAYFVKPRRAGGTLFAAALGLHAAMNDYRPRLGPGEVATVALIACDRRQARQLMNYVKGLIADSPLIGREVSSETAETITFTHRTQLEVYTMSFRSTRGYSYAAVICDEMAFWRDEYSATPDIELIRAVRPGLSNLGGRLIGLSSPHARRGHLFDMYQKHFGRDSDVLVLRAQHSQLNPTIDPKIIERAMAEDPEAARAEWFGEFRGDVSQWLDDALIDAALEGRTGGVRRPEVAFVDVSGGRRDASALSIAHAEDAAPGDRAPPRVVVDVLEHVKAPHEPASVVERFCQMLRDRRISKVTGDRYAAEWVVGAFKRHGIDYEPSELDKSSIYFECLAPFAERRVTLPNDKRLVTELRMLERRPRSGGRPDQVDHPSNGHDDAANAVCGSIWLAARGRGRTSYWDAASLPTVESVLRGAAGPRPL